MSAVPAAGRQAPLPPAAADWARIEAAAPAVGAVMRRYLRQLGTFLSPASVDVADNALRILARWMTEEAGLRAVGDIRRDHIEDFKLWLAARPRAGAGRSRPRRTGSECGPSGHSSSGSSSGTGQTPRPATP